MPDEQRFQAFWQAPSLLCWHWPGAPGATLAFPPAKPYVAGIINVTPDSFSDGGAYPTAADAASRALAMAEEGAAIVDVGGQSSRPGYTPISAAEEEERVLPVLAAIREASGGFSRRILISLDSDKPGLAEKALRFGFADILNDVSGGNPAMARAAAMHNAPLVLMHRPTSPGRGGLASVMEDLAAMRMSYTEAGLPLANIALDPGLGFGKSDEENLALLSNCRQLLGLGSPLYIGASRKRFIGETTGNPEAARRLGGSLAAAVWAASAGASILRVHDVKETAEALAMAAALRDSCHGAKR